jgi:hypothetical protein
MSQWIHVLPSIKAYNIIYTDNYIKIIVVGAQSHLLQYSKIKYIKWKDLKKCD